jgi:hypothetical protein
MVLSTKWRPPSPISDWRRPKAIILKGSDRNLLPMPTSARHIVTILTVALAGCGTAGCGTINEKIAAGVSDAIPAAIGGVPADAPPRPGTAKYDEYMRERERKRLLPASERGEEAKPAPSSGDATR